MKFVKNVKEATTQKNHITKDEKEKNTIQFYEKGCVEIVYGQSKHCFPLHSHESFCVGAITKGSAQVTINNTQQLLKEAMIFIIPSNTGITISSDVEYGYITICFKHELKKRVEGIRFNRYFVELNCNEEILDLCDAFRRDNDEKRFLNLVLELICGATDGPPLDRRNRSNEIVSLVCEYIKKHADQKFDLDKLAKAVYLSKYHLIRTFKREMGVTPNQYYIQAKMRIIKAELFKGQTETRLAANLSLSDQSHLCRLFKQQMGISIQDYKKNMTRDGARE